MSSQPKILIVDDSQTVRAHVRSMFQGSVQILEAKNGKEAVSLMHSHSPTLVLLDYYMPEMNGFDVLRYIQSNASLQRIPVVLMSGRPEDVLEQLPTLLRQVEFLAKPFEPAKLLRASHSAMKKSRVQSNSDTDPAKSQTVASSAATPEASDPSKVQPNLQPNLQPIQPRATASPRLTPSLDPSQPTLPAPATQAATLTATQTATQTATLTATQTATLPSAIQPSQSPAQTQSFTQRHSLESPASPTAPFASSEPSPLSSRQALRQAEWSAQQALAKSPAAAPLTSDAPIATTAQLPFTAAGAATAPLAEPHNLLPSHPTLQQIKSEMTQLRQTNEKLQGEVNRLNLQMAQVMQLLRKRMQPAR